MSWNRLELDNIELFGPKLNVTEKDGVFQVQIEGTRKYIQINKDQAHRLRRFISECLTDNTASQVQSFATSFDRCRGK